MEGIYLSNDILDKLEFAYTREGKIIKYNDFELIKIFKYYSQNQIDTLKTIEKYYQDLKEIPELLLHKKYIYDHFGLIKGILMNKGYEINLDVYKELDNISFNDLIIVLKNIGKVLEELDYKRCENDHLKTFFLGDLHEKNILVDQNTKNIQIIDLNSCKIENNKTFKNKYLEFLKTYSYVTKYLTQKYPFDTGYCTPNKNTDYYCYYVMIFNILFDTNITLLDLDEFYKKSNELKDEGLPKNLYENCLNLYNNVDNKNPYKLLDGIPGFFEDKFIQKRELKKVS